MDEEFLIDEKFLKYLEENQEQISIGQFIQSVKATISFFETLFFSQCIMRLENHIYNWIFDENLQGYFYQMCYNSFFNKDHNSLSIVFGVVSVNYGPDFLHENILRGLFDIYHKNHENKEFIDFICKFDIRLSQDKIIRDYILDEDNSDFPKELEGKLIENCLDNKNFDTLNKYFARDNQSNIDIIIKILNSRHKNAFTYVKEHRNLDDNISNIYERSDDIKDKDIKYKVIKYYANYVNQMYLELHGMNKSLRDMVQEIQSKLYLEKQEEVEGFTEEIGGLRKENLELSKKNNALSKENENLKTLCRKSISSLKEVQARLDESEEKSRQVFELGFIMGNTLPLETEVDTPQPDMVAKSQGSHVVQKGPRGK